MESLIPTINALQDALSTVKADAIQLPQIVVVGLQSSGKSSVLESIVGKDFLPRGKDIVTRCPLILQLIHVKDSKVKQEDKVTSPNSSMIQRISGQVQATLSHLNSIPYLQTSQEYAEFLHQPGKPYTDFGEVRKEIERETERRTGGSKKITAEPIRLKIFSNKVVDLTLIDLPGIAKIPVGEQPPDIEAQIRKMIITYIDNPNSIILAVIAANADLATSDALKLAREHDPDGKRTLGVLTKLDMLDKGVDASEVLQGKIIKVKLGMIGVVNRSQKDIETNLPIDEALKNEAAFLTKNYPDLEGQNGSAYLVKRLSTILMQHIHERLPDVKAQISSQLAKYRQKLRTYGETLEPNQKGPKLLFIVEKFATSFRSTIEGTVSIQKGELAGGAKVCELFMEKLSKHLDGLNALEGLKKDEIQTAIKNATGLVPAMNVPQRAFDLLVKEQLQKLEQPCLRCVDLVHEELERILEHCIAQIEQSISLYPNLNQELLTLSKNLLRGHLPKTKEVIGDLLSAQLDYINVRNEQFFGEYNKLVAAFEAQARNEQAAGSTQSQCPNQLVQLLRDLNLSGDQDSAKEAAQCEIMIALVQAYFKVIKNQMKDLVPKQIVCFLVNRHIRQLQQDLTSRLHLPEKFEQLFHESGDLAIKRKAAADMVAALEKGLEIINQTK